MGNKPFEITPDLLASHGQRLATYLLDAVFLIVGMVIAMIIVSTIAALAGSTAVVDYFTALNDFKLYCITAASMLAYYGLTETFYARSPAKYITKTMVVMADGSVPSQMAILSRSVCRLIPFDNFSFLLSNPPRGWHDWLSKTYVVDKARFEERQKSIS